ncbi:MAG: phosphomannomutase/phosphoglucomutase, partial [Myxococcota bacterium]
MNPAIFKAYDIRGLYPDELNADAALPIARAFARFLGQGPVVLGRDMRDSGGPLREALIQGLGAEGVEVIDIGRVATPLVYFATARLRAAGGVMITASHNPGAYNGLKLCGEAALPIGIETGLLEIRRIAEELEGSATPAARAEPCEQDVRATYYESLLAMFPARPRLRVVIDAGNGIAGEAVEGLLEHLPLNVTRLYFEPDGRFPNHEADPLKPENLEDLRREVERGGADLGVAFDGDGDRAVFVDEKAEPVPADLMTALLSRTVLEHHLLGAGSGARIVYDLRSSRVVAETVREAGAVPLRSRVGHAFMKQRMREEEACFGGELSGHYYFRFPAGYVADDGTAAMMLLLQAMELGGQPLSELWRPFRRYAQSGEVNRRVADVRSTLERVRHAFPEARADELDGVAHGRGGW